MKSVAKPLIGLAASVLLSTAAAGVALAQSQDVSLEKAQALYEKAYIYALPIIMSYKTMDAYAIAQGGANFKAPDLSPISSSSFG